MTFVDYVIRQCFDSIWEIGWIRCRLMTEIGFKKRRRNTARKHQRQQQEEPQQHGQDECRATTADCQEAQRCCTDNDEIINHRILKEIAQPVIKRVTQPSFKLITSFAHHKEFVIVSPVIANGPATLIRSASLLALSSLEKEEGEKWEDEDNEEDIEEVDWSRDCDTDVAPSLIVPRSSLEFKDNAFISQSPLFSNLLTIHEKQHKWIPDLNLPEWREPSKQEFEAMFPKAEIYENDVIFDTMTLIDPPTFQKFTLKPKRKACFILKTIAEILANPYDHM